MAEETVSSEKKEKKKHRRGNGEGTIYKRPDGTWCSQVKTGFNPKTGKPKRVTYYGKTRKEVVDKLDKAREEVKDGTFTEPTKTTLGEWLDRWMEVYKKPSLRVTTFENYETVIRCHIKPALGGFPLKKLMPSDLQKLYKEKQEGGRSDGKEGGLSSRMIHYIGFLIYSALEQAIEEGLISRNVAKATKLPKHEKKEISYLTTDEVNKFLEIAQESRYFTALQLELGTGLRRGELLGLKWQDIDFERGSVTIRRSLVRSKEGPRFHKPKTKSGIRMVKLPDEAIRELKAHKARQNQEKLLLGAAYNDSDLVFCQATGKLIEPRNFTRHFDGLLHKAGIRHVSFHSMRHTHATELLRLKVDMKTIQGRLGHKDFGTTANIYAHVADSLQDEAAEKINEVLKLGRK